MLFISFERPQNITADFVQILIQIQIVSFKILHLLAFFDLHGRIDVLTLNECFIGEDWKHHV